jgi:ribosomal protein L14
VKYRAKLKVLPQKEKEVVGEKILGRTYRELVEEQYGDVTQWAVLNNKR